MPTAKLLDGRPLSEPTDDGRRLLKRRLRVDLGEYLKPLHRLPYHWGVSMSKMGTRGWVAYRRHGRKRKTV